MNTKFPPTKVAPKILAIKQLSSLKLTVFRSAGSKPESEHLTSPSSHLAQVLPCKECMHTDFSFSQACWQGRFTRNCQSFRRGTRAPTLESRRLDASMMEVALRCHHRLQTQPSRLVPNKPPARVAARTLLSTPERKEQSDLRKTLSAHTRVPTDFKQTGMPGGITGASRLAKHLAAARSAPED